MTNRSFAITALIILLLVSGISVVIVLNYSGYSKKSVEREVFTLERIIDKAEQDSLFKNSDLYKEMLRQVRMIPPARYDDIDRNTNILNTNIALFGVILTFITILFSIGGYLGGSKILSLDRKAKELDEGTKKIEKYLIMGKRMADVNAEILLLSLPDFTESQQIPLKVAQVLKKIVEIVEEYENLKENSSDIIQNGYIELNKILLFYFEDHISLYNYLNNLQKIKENVSQWHYKEFLAVYYWKAVIHRQLNQFSESLSEFRQLYNKAKNEGNKGNIKYMNLANLGIAITVFKFIKLKNNDQNPINYESTRAFLEQIINYPHYWEKMNNKFSPKKLEKIISYNKSFDINQILCKLSLSLFYFLVDILEKEDYVLVSMTLIKLIQYIKDNVSNWKCDEILSEQKIGEFDRYLNKTFQIISEFKFPDDDSPNILSNYYYCEAIANHYYGNERTALNYINKALAALSDVSADNVKYVYSEVREELVKFEEYKEELRNFKAEVIVKINSSIPRYQYFWNKLYDDRKFLYGIEPSALAGRTVEIVKSMKIKNDVFNFLEIGCGYGRDLIYIASELLGNKDNYFFYGMDFTEIPVNYLSSFIFKKYNIDERQNENFLMFVGDIINDDIKIKINNVTFDIIYSHFFVHLFPEKIRKLIYAKVFELLKPGGYFIFSVLSKQDRLFILSNSEGEDDNKAKTIYPFSEKPWYSLSFFSKDNLMDEVKNYGVMEKGYPLELNEIENVDGSLRGTKYIAALVKKGEIE